MEHAPDPTPYDALLLVSFGGPEGPEEVMPFLERVTAGKNIPTERLREVGEHYFLFGGRSPINDHNRAFLKAMAEDLGAAGIDLPIYWGNRNSEPLLADTIAQMAADGVQRAACFVTSAYASYSSCRQYRENLYDAAAGVENAPRLDRLRSYHNHPGFVDAMTDATYEALSELPDSARGHAHLAFVTHSIPESMNDAAGPRGGAYVTGHRALVEEIVARVAEETGRRMDHSLVYCSRSGPPQVPWLEPDINDHLEALSEAGCPGVVAIPIGFVSDHMEVVYDLDTEAAETAKDLGLPYVRAATAGVDPRFVAVVRDLLTERAATERGEQPVRHAVGALPAPWDLCKPGCCANPRGDRPTVGEDTA